MHNGQVSVPLLRTTLLTRQFSIVTRSDREVSSEQGDESTEGRIRRYGWDPLVQYGVIDALEDSEVIAEFFNDKAR